MLIQEQTVDSQAKRDKGEKLPEIDFKVGSSQSLNK